MTPRVAGLRVAPLAYGAALLLAATVALATPARAQLTVGDSLWRLGRIDEAAEAYRRALADDRNAVRANFRLAQTLAWSNNIDSALVLLRAARARVPDDPDLLFTEATYLSWARRWPDALLRYDSLLAANPSDDFNYARVARARMLSWAGRFDEAAEGYRTVTARAPDDRDARFGLAQLSAWSGDLDAAARQYSALLVDDRNEVRTLVALAQVRLWQARYATARRLAERAAAVDSTNAEVREVQRAVRAATRPRVDASQSWSEDSDGNQNQWQSAGAQLVRGDGIRLGASLGFLDASDPSRSSRRAMGDVSLGMPVGRGTVSVSLAARSLMPGPITPGDPRPPTRTVLSGRGTLQQRVGGGVTFGVSVARWPFDEIAALMPRALDLTQWEGRAEWAATPKLRISTMYGGLDYSDGNRRRSWSARGEHRLAKGFGVGAFVTGFGFARREPIYFSPPRFLASEFTASWAREGTRWSGGVGAGLGAQRIDTLDTQAQWHLDARVSRRWTQGWELELTAGRSTSASASAVGAYSYSTLALALRRTL